MCHEWEAEDLCPTVVHPTLKLRQHSHGPSAAPIPCFPEVWFLAVHLSVPVQGIYMFPLLRLRGRSNSREGYGEINMQRSPFLCLSPLLATRGKR